MPTETNKTRGRGVPTYLREPSRSRAYCWVYDDNDRRRKVVLGKIDSPESWRKFAEILEKVGTDEPMRPCRGEEGDGPTIADIAARYVVHCQNYYRKDGVLTSEFGNIKSSLRPLLRLYADEPATDFGPVKLRKVREEFVRQGLTRTGVNRRVSTLKRFLKWATSLEVVPVRVYESVRTLEGLKKGRTTARETAPVRPAVMQDVEATLPFMSRQVAAMTQLMASTGMRAGEVVAMTSGALDRNGPIWTYSPSRFKTEHHEHLSQREIPLGPRSQQILQGFLRADPHAPLFQPKEAVAERKAALRASRQSKVPPSQRERDRLRQVNSRERAREKYSVDSLRHAIKRACLAAGVHPFHPHQLRHLRGTEIRRHHGVEAARISLGLSNISTAEIYAERDADLAVRIAEQMG